LYQALIGVLLFIFSADAALFYAAETLPERDYSRIADPQLRVGYCMAANTSLFEKYLLAASIARSPDIELFSFVMSYALGGENTEQKKAALRALRERDDLRGSAIRSSFRVAEQCGYRKVTWPPGVTLLDISVNWLRHDSTFLYFLDRTRGEPDAADLIYRARAGQMARGGT